MEAWQRCEQLEQGIGQRHDMSGVGFEPIGGNCPSSTLEVELLPSGVAHLASATTS